MKLKGKDRAAVKALTPDQTRAFELLARACEQVGIGQITDVQGICEALKQERPVIWLFTCLGTEPRKEELLLNIKRSGLLSSSRYGRAQKLLASLAEILPIEVRLILPDAEPCRVWGWDVPQNELTGYCHMMIEEAEEEGLLPDGWTAVNWTDLERDALANAPTLDDALLWADRTGQLADVRAELLLMIRHSHIATRGQRIEVGMKLTAHLAYEAALLRALGPAILLHTDGEGARRERMMQRFGRYHDCEVIPLIHGIRMR